jgi:hypothetical protein
MSKVGSVYLYWKESRATCYADGLRLSIMGITGWRGATFSLSVANAGEPIPPAVMAQLFLPLHARRGAPDAAGPRARTLYRVGDCPGAWREDRRGLIGGGDAVYVQHADGVGGRERRSAHTLDRALLDVITAIVAGQING